MDQRASPKVISLQMGTWVPGLSLIQISDADALKTAPAPDQGTDMVFSHTLSPSHPTTPT